MFKIKFMYVTLAKLLSLDASAGACRYQRILSSLFFQKIIKSNYYFSIQKNNLPFVSCNIGDTLLSQLRNIISTLLTIVAHESPSTRTSNPEAIIHCRDSTFRQRLTHGICVMRTSGTTKEQDF